MFENPRLNPSSYVGTAQYLVGGDGRDGFLGGAGNDYIDSRGGQEWWVSGGWGSDYFVFDYRTDLVRIADFEVGVDKIVVGSQAALNSIKFTNNGNGQAELSLNSGTFLLDGINASSLSASDFVLRGTPTNTPTQMNARLDPSTYNGASQYLVGGDGRDGFLGGAGNDYIDSRGGQEWWVSGGSGSDYFVFDYRTDLVRIADFEVGVDKIVVDNQAALNSIKFTNNGNGQAELSLNSGTFLLDGINASSLSASDFVVRGATTNTPTQWNARLDPSTYSGASEYLVGGSGRDGFLGGDGNDYIDSRGGQEWWVSGGSGSDYFVFDYRTDLVRIADFEVGVDKIVVGSQAALNSIKFTNNGNGQAELSLNSGTFLLDGINASSLSANDFVVRGATTNTPTQVNARLDPSTYSGASEYLVGGDGRDGFLGGDGNDYIDSRGGQEWWVSGGSGSDYFVFDYRTDLVRIADFEVGVDKIVVGSQAALNSIKFTNNGNGQAELSLNSGTFLLDGINASSLSANDFVVRGATTNTPTQVNTTDQVSAPSPADPAGPLDPVKILFVGNSYQYFSADSPLGGSGPLSPNEMFLQMAEAGFVEIEAKTHWIGGASLQRHLNEGKVANSLATQDYDLIVVNAAFTPWNTAGFNAANSELVNLAGSDTPIAYYGEWGPDYWIRLGSDGEVELRDKQGGHGGENSYLDAWESMYSSAANKYGGAYMPVGQAYARAYEALAEKYASGLSSEAAKGTFVAEDLKVFGDPLYDRNGDVIAGFTADAIHSGPVLSYLAAAVQYATIFGEAAPGTLINGVRDSDIWVPEHVSVSDARLMLDIAWETVQDHAINLISADHFDFG